MAKIFGIYILQEHLQETLLYVRFHLKTYSCIEELVCNSLTYIFSIQNPLVFKNMKIFCIYVFLRVSS